MQGVDLATAVGALMQQSTDEHQEGQNTLAEGAIRNFLQLTADVAQDAACVSLQLFQRLTHALELPGKVKADVGASHPRDIPQQGTIGNPMSGVEH